MIQFLAVGAAAVIGAIVVTALLMWALTQILISGKAWLLHPPYGLKSVLALIFVSMWLMATMGFAIVPWAFAFLYLGGLPDFETALYFSAVTFTTVGYGDVLLPSKIRLLSGLCAANGLLIFGLFTAFLVEFVRRLRETQRSIIEESKQPQDV